MKNRGIYTILQTDRVLREEVIRAFAQEEIAHQMMDFIKEEFSASIIKEEPSPKYPYGRYYLDLDIQTTEF